MERETASVSSRVKTPYPGRQREEEACPTCKRPWKSGDSSEQSQEKGGFKSERRPSDPKQNHGKLHQSKETYNRTQQDGSSYNEKSENSRKNPSQKGDMLSRAYNQTRNTQRKQNESDRADHQARVDEQNQERYERNDRNSDPGRNRQRESQQYPPQSSDRGYENERSDSHL